MDTIYLEQHLRDHPRVRSLLERFGQATVIECERYTEVFNPAAQNFRLQKRRPALILAEKHGKRVLPAPPGYSIGRSTNFYFSHMLNCLYDCRYCFLQGMYRSAHYVYFVNLEDFETGIDEVRAAHPEGSCFFSGYDCDSLAMESVTGFAERFVPFFSERPDAWLELRTKSLNTSTLERAEPVANIIPAFTLTPDPIASAIEHGAPANARRLDRVESLARQGWRVGIRLDPLVPWPGFERLYRELIEEIARRVPAEAIHSVTLGPMRFPKSMYDRIVRLHGSEELFAIEEMKLRDGRMTFDETVEHELVSGVHSSLARELGESRLFRQA